VTEIERKLKTDFIMAKAPHQMTAEERDFLWGEVAACDRDRNQQPVSRADLPANAPPNLSAEQQEVLAQNWEDYIMARPSNSWTPEERACIAARTQRVLRKMGY
jgi:hypothetical protein